MYTLKVQPEGGVPYELTHDYGEFIITRIDGLCPPMSSINISDNGIQDGGSFNSARLETRNLVLNVTLRGNIDASRRKLYTLFPAKKPVTIFFSDGVRDVKCVGYVEQPDCCPFDFPSKAQISLICPDPYWHDVTDVETESFGEFETVTISNTGTAAVGFRAVVEFSASVTPSVTLGEATADLPAVYPYSTNLFLRPVDEQSVYVGFDPETQKIGELMVANSDITSRMDSVDLVTKQDDLSGTNAKEYIRVVCSAGTLASGTYPISYAIASIPGGSAENVECRVFESTHFSNSSTLNYCNINFDNVRPGIELDENTDYVKLYLRNASGWVEILQSDYSLVGTHEFYYAAFAYNLIGAGYTAGKLVVYHDTTDADIRTTLVLHYYGSTRNVATDWECNLYQSIPAGFNAAKDVPYINGERITAADIEECYIVPSSGSVEAYTIIYGSPGNSAEFRYVYSLSSEDIRELTDTEIDAGLEGTAFTEGLVLWNNTTGEWMQFKSTRFQLGDKLEISTVPLDLYAKITERDGETADISLLYDVYKNGQFFKLIPGDNEIEITAESGGENVSAEITANFVHGGV